MISVSCVVLANPDFTAGNNIELIGRGKGEKKTYGAARRARLGAFGDGGTTLGT